MMSFNPSGLRWIYTHIEEILVVILLSLMSVVVTLQVFYRLVLQNPLIWTEELATILFVWVVMIGASLALKLKEHFAVELLHKKLGSEDRRLGGIIVGLSLIVFSLLILVEGVKLTLLSVGVTTAAMEISRVYLFAALPVGGILMLLRSIELLYQYATWKADTTPKEPGDETISETEVAV